MKATSIILGTLLLLLTQAARSQQFVQPDTTPAVQGWVPLASGTSATLRVISLVGRDTVFLSGDDLLRSTDAGASWERLTGLPLQSGQLLFLNARNGILTGAGLTFRTTDAGRTWTDVDSIPNVNGTQLYFVNDQFGWNYNGYNSWGHRTTDGGMTWTYFSGPGINWPTIAFADPRVGFMGGELAAWLPEPRWPKSAAFAITMDSGRHWKSVYTGLLHGDIFAITAVDTAKLFVFGSAGLIGYSTDAGLGWDTIPRITSEHFQGAFFLDPRHGAAVGSSGLIAQTSDSGRTWHRQRSGITDGSYLYAVAFVDTILGYTVGDGGSVLKTTNGGQSWVSTQTSPSLSISTTPNPADQTITLNYSLDSPQHIRVQVFSSAGQLITTAVDGLLQNPGVNAVMIDTQGMPSGTYEFRLEGESIAQTGSFVVTH